MTRACISDISQKVIPPEADFLRVLHSVRKTCNPVLNLFLRGGAFLTARSSFIGAHSFNFNRQRMNHFNFSLYFPLVIFLFWLTNISSGKWKIYDAKALNSKYRSKTSEEFGKQLNAFREKLKWKNLTKV